MVTKSENQLIWPKKTYFCIFNAFFLSFAPFLITVLESADFFWIFEMLKSKIHFFRQIFFWFFQRVPPMDFGYFDVYESAGCSMNFKANSKISSPNVLDLWVSFFKNHKPPKTQKSAHFIHPSQIHTGFDLNFQQWTKIKRHLKPCPNK